MTLPRPGRAWIGPLILIAVALFIAVACMAGPTGSPGASGSPAPTPTNPAAVPLAPAQPTDPFNLISWLFTPLFQAFFIVLVLLDKATGNIAIAIVLMTLLLRIVLIPIFRRQTVSTKRSQLLAPELREIQKRYKGDRLKAQEAQKQLYAERGINPLAGCLPALLQILLLIPMYSVFSQGLQNYNPQAMLDVFGFRIIDLQCDPAPIIDELGHVLNPCLDPVAFGVNWGVPEVFLGTAGSLFSGLSLLAIISAAPPADHVADGPAGREPGDGRRPERPDPAPDGVPVPVHLADVRQHPAGRPVPVLDRVDPVLDRPAVPDHRLGRHVPVIRMESRVRPGPHTTVPGGPAAAGRSRDATGQIGARRGSGKAGGSRRQDHSPQGTRPLEPPRETTLMSAYKEFTGKSVEEALRGAREEFGVDLAELDFEILTPGQPGRPRHGRRTGADRRRPAVGPRRSRTQARGRGIQPAPARPAPRGSRSPGRPRPAARSGDRGPRRDDRPRDDRGPRRDDRGPRRDDRPRESRPADDRPRRRPPA